MSIIYHRNNHKSDQLETTVDHVRQHISAIASPQDDPDAYYDEVEITLSEAEDGSTRVYGQLDREPSFDYSLPEDYVPPPADEYQRGFGERNMTPEELQEHLLRKAGLK